MGQYTVWIENLNIVKMLILLKLIYRFNISPIKIPVGYFAKIDKLILKFKKKIKENRIDKIISKKKIMSEDSHYLIDYRETGIQRV